VERLATARRDLEALRHLDAGRLRVGAFPTAVAWLVPRALAAFRADHPKVVVTLVEDRTPGLLNRLESGDADVAVVSAPPDDEPLDRSRFTLHQLLDEQLLVAMPADHPMAQRPQVRQRLTLLRVTEGCDRRQLLSARDARMSVAETSATPDGSAAIPLRLQKVEANERNA
jgi:DNA-binding transcriptional LysR family regulator